VKCGDFKPSLFWELGILEGMIHGWMEEEKQQLFVDQVHVKIGHDRKRARCSNVSEVDQCLYAWFVQKFFVNKNFHVKNIISCEISQNSVSCQ
jgi:hypothetical protein